MAVVATSSFATDEREILDRYRAGHRAQQRVRLTRRLISLVAVAGLWEIVGRNVSPIFLPTFSSMVAAFAGMVVSGELLHGFWLSIEAMLIGYSLAVVVGVTAGLLMGRYRVMENLLDLYLTIFLAAPMAAMIPIAIIVFGLSTAARIAVIFFFVVVYVAINTFAGVKAVRADLVEMGRAFMLSEQQLFRWVILPNAAPLILAGVRLGFGRAITGMLLSEMIILSVGIGDMLLRLSEEYRTAHVFATILGILIFAVIGGSTIQRLDRWINRWQPAR